MKTKSQTWAQKQRSFQRLRKSPLRCMCVCAKSLESCLTLGDPMDCSPPGSFVRGIIRARILEWVAMPSFRGSCQPRDRTHISRGSYIAGGFITTEPHIREAPYKTPVPTNDDLFAWLPWSQLFHHENVEPEVSADTWASFSIPNSGLPKGHLDIAPSTSVPSLTPPEPHSSPS